MNYVYNYIYNQRQLILSRTMARDSILWLLVGSLPLVMLRPGYDRILMLFDSYPESQLLYMK